MIAFIFSVEASLDVDKRDVQYQYCVGDRGRTTQRASTPVRPESPVSASFHQDRERVIPSDFVDCGDDFYYMSTLDVFWIRSNCDD